MIKRTLQEKIRDILKPWSVDMSEDVAKYILSLIKQEVKKCLDIENTREYTPREDMFGVGYTQAQTDMEKNLKKRGILT